MAGLQSHLPSQNFQFVLPRARRQPQMNMPGPQLMPNMGGEQGLNMFMGLLKNLGIDVPSLLKGFFSGQKQACYPLQEKTAALEYVPFVTAPLGAIVGNTLASSRVAQNAPTEEQKQKDILYGTLLGGLAGLSFGVALPLSYNYIRSLFYKPVG